MATDPDTGATRIVLTATQKTFLIGARWSLLQRLFTWLPHGEKFIWMSERDGWNHLYLYDLDGNLLWEIHGMSGLTVPTPFSAHGLVYIGSGYPGGALRPLYAVRPGASGDISLWPDGKIKGSYRFPGERASSEYVAWSYPLLGTYNTTGLAYGDFFYTLLDRGFLLCHDAKTGEETYGRQRIEIGSGFSASPWAYNDKVFLLSEDGDTYVIQAGAEFKVIGKNSLNEMTLATPAVVRGSLILRTRSKLYRIAGRQRR
ncbi:DPP IV N-terminal domain-containing protein, partial [Candidatus Sumerlaeota bacterium]|nr:DPP IV N-terminal domain-containing protein [Candidatus Sumerlaeota bacterium]